MCNGHAARGIALAAVPSRRCRTVGLFETPIVLTALAVGLVVFVALRWKGRPRDEWRKENKPDAPSTGS
jgi:hypothetical protein